MEQDKISYKITDLSEEGKVYEVSFLATTSGEDEEYDKRDLSSGQNKCECVNECVNSECVNSEFVNSNKEYINNKYINNDNNEYINNINSINNINNEYINDNNINDNLITTFTEQDKLDLTHEEIIKSNSNGFELYSTKIVYTEPEIKKRRSVFYKCVGKYFMCCQ
ncbi:hypothetical protein NAPIS_ORF00228 [Vairimorpha apis BRL 01]|uniref:Uncharacterized protein n=1 Tax=Vairimorpha apis BRL 01 TaxID=1037528 RepID=T0MGE5_9MICR|nr:hypothetical protein NAPIS_ORF00228 [Vairimorpha apis BRL 01]